MSVRETLRQMPGQGGPSLGSGLPARLHLDAPLLAALVGAALASSSSTRTGRIVIGILAWGVTIGPLAIHVSERDGRPARAIDAREAFDGSLVAEMIRTADPATAEELRDKSASSATTMGWTDNSGAADGDALTPVVPESNTEDFTNYGINGFTLTERDGLSTFAVDVDTASYTITRRKLREGYLPPQDAVRVEELRVAPHPSAHAGLALRFDAALVRCRRALLRGLVEFLESLVLARELCRCRKIFLLLNLFCL